MLLAGWMLASGCAALFPNAKPPEVSDSQLNWLNIRYRPADTSRHPCRIEIIGAGYLHFMQGASPRLADGFSTDTAHAQWANLTEEKLGMTPAETRALLQRFVDAGLLKAPARPRNLDPDAPGIAWFRWRLNNQSGACVTANADLIDLVDAIAVHVGRQER